MNSRNEVRRIHPVAAVWLTDQGYQFEHEYQLPLRGRVDFYAWHDTKPALLLDCKIDARKLRSSIRQVLDYRAQFDSPITPALAMPQREISETTIATCCEHNVMLVALPLVLYRVELDSTLDNLLHILSARSGVPVGELMSDLIISHPELHE